MAIFLLELRIALYVDIMSFGVIRTAEETGMDCRPRPGSVASNLITENTLPCRKHRDIIAVRCSVVYMAQVTL